MADTRQTVKANQLRPGMVILEVSELSFDFGTLDPALVKFVQNGFAGATAVVVGDAGKEEIPVAQLKEFDQLQEITNIPGNLKLAKVAQGMGALMEKKGLLEFKVAIAGDAPVPSPEEDSAGAPALVVGSEQAKKIHEQKVAEVKDFMAKVEDATESRDKASNMVEEMLDSGRGGNFSSKGVETMVHEILDGGSTPAMKAIAGLRGSDQTYAHCTDMAAILQDCYANILVRMGKEVSSAINRFTLLSGFMHDIGKSEVPKDILESTARFEPDSREMLLLRNHTTYGARILNDMGMHDTIINVAHFHHVKKDSTMFTSYPSVDYDLVKPITRLASIVDVYQALIGRRKYKKNWVPGKAVEYIVNLKGSEFDEKIMDQFLRSMGRYPVGSLVRLSTKELAFVLMIAPPEHSDRPIVAVVENPDGELLTHHALLDLMVEKDIFVEEIVDHYEKYSETEDHAYRIFQSIRIE